MMFQSDGQVIQEKSPTAQVVKQIRLQSALRKQNFFLYIFLTVQFRIMLVGNQLEAQFLL